MYYFVSVVGDGDSYCGSVFCLAVIQTLTPFLYPSPPALLAGNET